MDAAFEAFDRDLPAPTREAVLAAIRSTFGRLPPLGRIRALKWFGLSVAQFDLLTPELLKNFLLAMPRGVALQVLRTWAFAWVTSARFHDTTRLPCCLGCVGAKDAQDHYMRCAPMWEPVPPMSGHPVPPEPGGRAALTLSFGDAHNLAMVTNAYHTARRRAC